MTRIALGNEKKKVVSKVRENRRKRQDWQRKSEAEEKR